MKKFLSFLISLSLVILFLIPRIVELELHQMMLLFSILPLTAILSGINGARPTFKEIKHQKFRLTMYGISIALFLLCFLSCMGVLSITRMDRGMMTTMKTDLIMVMGYGIFALMVVNMVISTRDITRRKKGLPL